MKSSKFSFLVYDSSHAPRYFEIKKNLFRFLFLGLPSLSLLLISGLIATGVYLKKTDLPKFAHYLGPSQRTKELEKENKHLQNELKSLRKENIQLLSKTKPETLPPNPDILDSLIFFKPQPGQKDITESIEIKIQQVKTTTYKKNLKIDFAIVNMNRVGQRTNGHIFILMQSKDKIHIWPNTAFNNIPFSIRFDSGEHFSTFRFRPVTALFSRPHKTVKVFFKILIFNKDGDLILEETIPHLI